MATLYILNIYIYIDITNNLIVREYEQIVFTFSIANPKGIGYFSLKHFEFSLVVGAKNGRRFCIVNRDSDPERK